MERAEDGDVQCAFIVYYLGRFTGAWQEAVIGTLANRRLAIPVLARSGGRARLKNSYGRGACGNLVAGRARDFFEAIDRHIGVYAACPICF